MSNQKIQLQNCFILLMGFPGVGKRTVGEAFARKTNARFTHHHELYDPIFKLFCNDYEDQSNLTPQMWEKLNEAQAVYFAAVADVCSRDDSFIYTEMMLDKDPYHQIDYKNILDVVKKRNAHFFPVRLIFEEDELIKRVQSNDRIEYSEFKTRDPDLSKKRSRELNVFYSHHENEMTIDNTNLSADLVADRIIQLIQLKLKI